MRLNLLQQYAKLRQQLMEEKSQLETRLNELNQVLGSETTSPQAPQPAQTQEAPAEVDQPKRRGRPPGRRGRRPSAGNTMSMREAVLKALSNGPVARRDLVQAVEGVGFKFKTKNPLNSIGAVLYGKSGGVVKTADGRFALKAGAATTSNGRTEQRPGRKKRRKLSREGRARIAAAA